MFQMFCICCCAELTVIFYFDLLMSSLFCLSSLSLLVLLISLCNICLDSIFSCFFPLAVFFCL